MTSCRPLALSLIAALSLAGCGNDQNAADLAGPMQVIVNALKLNKAAQAPTLLTLDQAGVATLRQALEDDGQPIYQVGIPSLKYSNLMAPFGQNGDVQTWASPGYETISMRGGIVIATRGFGPDIMSSTGPGIGQISAATGTTQRSYYYLDGADQPHRFDYVCTLAPAGSESVTVLGKVFATRKVVETCVGGAEMFTNEYWFDKSATLRRSEQRLAPGIDKLLLQRVID